MNMRAVCALLVLAALLVMAALGCDCSARDTVAELVRAQDDVDRDWAHRLNYWQPAAVGAEFAMGDGLRTGVEARATLEFNHGGLLHVEPSSVIRFSATAPEEDGQLEQPAVEVLTGEAELLASGAGMRFVTAIGRAMIAADSKVRVIQRDGAVRYQVTVGTALVETKDGLERLEAGQGVEIQIGSAQIVRFDLDEPETADPAEASLISTAQTPSEPEVQARVERPGASHRAPGTEAWDDLAKGSHTVQTGSELRLRASSRVRLSRGKEQALLEAGHYVVGGPEDALVRVVRGRVMLDQAHSGVTIHVPNGTIVARSDAPAGTSARMQVDGAQETEVSVREGAVEIRRGGTSQTLTAGGSWSSAGGNPKHAPAPLPGLDDRGPEHAELVLPAGETATVHDPRPPFDLAVRTLRHCPEGAEVRVSGRRPIRARGASFVHVRLGPGAHFYRVHCLVRGKPRRKPVIRGRLRVLRDSGTAKLPARPPETEVDTDGRNYRVMYQNRLPVIGVRWPRAPKASGYELRVDSEHGGKRRFRASSPKHAFSSGQLRDGRHRLTFWTEDSKKHSKTTLLHIRFDNAAPAASLREPVNSGFEPGATVNVRGVALAGWTASVRGTALEMDAQHRFSGQVQLADNAKALVIRMAHRRRGVHYYVRRPQGVSR